MRPVGETKGEDLTPTQGRQEGLPDKVTSEPMSSTQTRRYLGQGIQERELCPWWWRGSG